MPILESLKPLVLRIRYLFLLQNEGENIPAFLIKIAYIVLQLLYGRSI